MNSRISLQIAVWCASAPFVVAGHLGPNERQGFVRWFADNIYQDELNGWRMSGKSDAWEMSLFSFDLDGDGNDEIIASTPYYQDHSTDFPLVYSSDGSGWKQSWFPDTRFCWLDDASITEFAGEKFRLSVVGPATGPRKYKSFVSDNPRVSRSRVPGAPDVPSIVSEQQVFDWLAAFERGADSVAELPEETCVGVTDDGGGNEVYRCFFERIDYSVLGIETNGTGTFHEFAGGVRDLIADHEFRSWIRSVPVDVFAGTNAEPRLLAGPRSARPGSYRTNVETNALSRSERLLLAETLSRDGFPTNGVQVIVCDFDEDGDLDAFASTDVPLDGSAAEWRAWRQANGAWHPVSEPLSLPRKTIRSDFGARMIVPPSIPSAVVAGPDDFYRIWHSAGGSFVNVFRVTGSNPWDVASPLSDAETPNEMKRTRFLNGYRRVYPDWIALHDFFHSGTDIRPPCDFFDLFDGCSGMIQLDRLLPEDLLP